MAISLPVSAYLPKVISAALLPYISYIIIGLITVAMIRVDLGRVIFHLRRPISLLLSLGLLLVAVPIGMNWLAGVLALSLPIHMALILMACAPPLGSAPNLAYLLKLDAELVFNVTIAGTLILPFIAPWIIGLTLGEYLEIDSWALFERLLITVGLSFLFAAIIRKILGNERIKKSGDELDGVSTLVMLLFVITAMGGVSEIIKDDPFYVLYLLVIVLSANFGAQIFFSLVGIGVSKVKKDIPTVSALSFGMVAGNRNLGLFAAVIPLQQLEQILPFLALYQVPIYLTPLVGGLFYGSFLKDGKTGPVKQN